MALRQIVTGFGSRVGARSADNRPSYGRRHRQAMRPEATLSEVRDALALPGLGERGDQIQILPPISRCRISPAARAPAVDV